MKGIRGNKKMNFHDDREFYKINSQREKLSFTNIDEENIKIINTYNYAVIYFLDRVSIVDIRKTPVTKPLENVVGIRAFNEDGEYFVSRDAGHFVGRIITDFEEKVDVESFEIVDEYHKLWGKVSKDDRTLLTEDRGITLKLPFELETGKNIAFMKVRNYFTPEGDLRNVDFRLCGFETGLENGKEG